VSYDAVIMQLNSETNSVFDIKSLCALNELMIAKFESNTVNRPELEASPITTC